MSRPREKSAEMTPGLTASERIHQFTARFGEEVKIGRQSRKLTQKHLAEELHTLGVEVTQGYLSQIENGIRVEPGLKVVVALSITLNISLDALLGEFGIQKPAGDA